MRYSFLSIFVLLLLNISVSAQTKKIAFESHSGKTGNFRISLDNALFDDEGSDFGEYQPPVRYHVDSVILNGDRVFVRIAVNYLGYNSSPYAGKGSAISYQNDTINVSTLNMSRTRHYPIDSLKRIFTMQNKWGVIDNETIFSGFEKMVKHPKTSKKKNKEAVKQDLFPLVVESPGPDDPPVDRTLLYMLSTILLLSLGGGWLSWYFYKPKPQPAG